MFKRIDQRKSFLDSGHELLLKNAEIRNILQNSYLHDCRSHFIVTKEGMYDEQGLAYGLAPVRIKILQDAYNNGLTILVKDLENWSEAIQKKCRDIGTSVNVHLYLTPSNGTGFDWHTDDRDVYVFMQKGEKTFHVEEFDGEIKNYTLKAGDKLFIPYGARHKATAHPVVSCHLSFGQWPSQTIRELYANYDYPMDIDE